MSVEDGDRVRRIVGSLFFLARHENTLASRITPVLLALLVAEHLDRLAVILRDHRPLGDALLNPPNNLHSRGTAGAEALRIETRKHNAAPGVGT